MRLAIFAILLVAAVGTGYWYVVRSKVDACRVGTYGFATSGTERISTSCP